MAKQFVEQARGAAFAWKQMTATLPDDARVGAGLWRNGGERGGPTPFCIPPRHADRNLLPEARPVALGIFGELGIPWHNGTPAGPPNHLLSSQVQSANALAPLVHDPARLRRLFEPVLPIAEVLPIENAWYVTFEWIGLVDHLSEGRPGQRRTRGALATSADAAIRYRTPQRTIEVALIEWKYVEEYAQHRLAGGEASNETRRARYRPLWDDPDCPVRHDVIPYDDLFAEPFYQLFRQTLLGWRMEQAAELDATRVRNVLVAPLANRELLVDSRTRRSHRQAGATIVAAWRAALVDPDRFAFLDSARLVDPDLDLTSDEFRDRYGHLAG